MKNDILFITSYPPRECGIATYSQDLIRALTNKFSDSFSFHVCALETGAVKYEYPSEVKYVLNTSVASEYYSIASAINSDKNIDIVVIQHEFGFFQPDEKLFSLFLSEITKPIVLVFHTVLPAPGDLLKAQVRGMISKSSLSVVMTESSKKILSQEYEIPDHKIVVIPHGTHLVQHLDKDYLKKKYGLTGKKVLSTFGLLSSGKGVETTIDALTEITQANPDVVFLIIGKTHPDIVVFEGEKYRNMLEDKVQQAGLGRHVKFINQYLPLTDLLEYLQLTDIYLFTSKDPNQAVSGTFSYAMSCACPIISTPIPHAREILSKDTGIIIGFQNTKQLVDGVNKLMNDDQLRYAFSSSTLERIIPTSWENSAIAHALLLKQVSALSAINVPLESSMNCNVDTIAKEPSLLEYSLPPINLEHIKKMTTDIGIIQFSKINHPDIESGYTLDDNARALIAICMHYEFSGDSEDLGLMKTYLDFISHCQMEGGGFLNYVDYKFNFTTQNNEGDLHDSNGRAIWALGYLISKKQILPLELVIQAEEVLNNSIPFIEGVHSTRAMAFAIKGLCFCNIEKKSSVYSALIVVLGNRLLQMYRHESEPEWEWYESYLTYANSVIPEAMLLAWVDSHEQAYKDVAKSSFDFLLRLTFRDGGIRVISNQKWLHKGNAVDGYGEQPIDVAYTVLAMDVFYQIFKEKKYSKVMLSTFSWFLGNNHLHQIVYNPCTGGCYDGLEEKSVNLNQGSESTLSYLMARLTVEKHRNTLLANEN